MGEEEKMEKRKSLNKKILIVVAVLVGIFVIIGAIGGDGSSNGEKENGEETTNEATSITQRFLDGGWTEAVLRGGNFNRTADDGVRLALLSTTRDFSIDTGIGREGSGYAVWNNTGWATSDVVPWDLNLDATTCEWDFTTDKIVEREGVECSDEQIQRVRRTRERFYEELERIEVSIDELREWWGL